MDEARFRPGRKDGFDTEEDEEDDMSPSLRPVGAVCLPEGPVPPRRGPLGVHGQQLGVHGEQVVGTLHLTRSGLGR